MRIFTGLITHKNSQYRDTETFRNLEEVLSRLDQTGEVSVVDTDSYTERDISLKHVLARIFLVALWDYRVKRFRKNSLSRSLYALAREAKNELRRGLGRKARRWLARNRNITAAHVSLWSAALESRADWLLIAEDDVVIVDPTFNEKVEALLTHLESRGNSSVAIFLSGSFTPEEHMAENLQFVSERVGATEIRIGVEKGWTDTVAATIYSRLFIEKLLRFFSGASQLTKDLLPVDQFVDVFLIKVFSEGSELLTVHPEPSFCAQQSLLNERR